LWVLNRNLFSREGHLRIIQTVKALKLTLEKLHVLMHLSQIKNSKALDDVISNVFSLFFKQDLKKCTFTL
jgi:hypothetical protein